ncbi:fibronectin type III domain-containing protein [Athalassotoga saccharophila]|uniref:fibronectin type III domain-containing protein n=1 Tax=Athalassotoga saccharophila TaxID=1441386 RepID=UPI001379998A|nr:fibronectin type III domain-containing protein [Athalassotoga saccharophila]BBJ28531.1 chitinase [Athalassotoga saccharophila]
MRYFKLSFIFSILSIALILSSCMNVSQLNVPSNPVPYNGETGVSLNPTFNFTDVGPAGDKILYDVYFGTSPTSLSKLENQISTTSFFLSFTLKAGTTYYWQIVAHDETTGLIVTGPIWSFTTKSVQPPNTPSNPNPYNGQTGVSLSPTLSWSGGGTSGDVIEYTIFFGTSPMPSSILTDGIQNTYYTVTNLNPNTTYYWQIDAYDYTTGLYVIGPVWSFTTGN